jgi:hypothetical protein
LPSDFSGVNGKTKRRNQGVTRGSPNFILSLCGNCRLKFMGWKYPAGGDPSEAWQSTACCSDACRTCPNPELITGGVNFWLSAESVR